MKSSLALSVNDVLLAGKALLCNVPVVIVLSKSDLHLIHEREDGRLRAGSAQEQSDELVALRMFNYKKTTKT